MQEEMTLEEEREASISFAQRCYFGGVPLIVPPYFRKWAQTLNCWEDIEPYVVVTEDVIVESK